MFPSDNKDKPNDTKSVTSEILSIKSGRLSQLANAKIRHEKILKGEINNKITSVMDWFNRNYGDMEDNFNLSVASPLAEIFKQYLEKEGLKVMNQYKERIKNANLDEDISKIRTSLMSDFRNEVDGKIDRVKDDVEDLKLGVFGDIDETLREAIPSFLHLRDSYTSFIRAGGDKDDFQDEEEQLSEVDLVMVDPQEEIFYELPRKKQPNEKEDTVLVEQMKRYESNGKKKTKTDIPANKDSFYQSDITFWLEKSIKNDNIPFQSVDTLASNLSRSYEPFFTAKHIRGDIDPDITPVELNNFISTALGQERDSWLVRDVPYRAEDLARIENIPDGADLTKLYKGILELNAEEISFSLNNLWSVSNNIASGYNVPNDKQVRFSNLTSQIIGFLYASFSVHGPNLLEKSETIFNQVTGVGRDNIAKYLINISKIGGSNAAEDLFYRMKDYIAENLQGYFKVSNYLDSRQGEIGVYGITYLYNLLWEENGNLSDWSVVSTLARGRPLGLNQRQIAQRFKNGKLINSIRNNNPDLEDFITKCLARGCSSESILTAYVTLITVFSEVNNGSEENKALSLYALDELTDILNVSASNGGRIINFSRSTHLIIEYLFDIITYVLPLVVVNNYRFYAAQALRNSTSGFTNPLLRYVKHCGYNLDPLIPNNGSFIKQRDIVKTAISGIEIKEGHLVLDVENSFLSSLSFRNEITKDIQLAVDALRLTNNIVITTPQIPRNMGLLFRANPIGIKPNKADAILTHTLVSYFTGFAQVLFDSPPSGTYVHSITLEYEIGATINGEQINESIHLGAAEILNVIRDELISDKIDYNIFAKKVYQVLNLRVYQYTDFVKSIAQYFNELKFDDFSELGDSDSISKWAEKHFSKYKEMMGGSLIYDISNSIFKKLVAAKENMRTDFSQVEERELIEESNGSYFIFTWLAIHARAYKDSLSPLQRSDPNFSIDLKLNSVGRGRFTLNLVSAPVQNILQLKQYLNANHNISNTPLPELLQFFDRQVKSRLITTYALEMERPVSLVGGDNVNMWVLHNKMRKDAELSLKLPGSENIERYITQLRSYNLFSIGANDHLNNLNTGYIRFGRVNIPTPYFSTIGVPCSYFSLWFLVLNTMIENNELPNSNVKFSDGVTIKSIYDWVSDQIIELETKKYNNPSTKQANRVQIFCKKILTPEMAFNPPSTQKYTEKTEEGLTSLKSLGEEMENAFSISRTIARDETECNFLSVPHKFLSFWGYPLKDTENLISNVIFKKMLNHGPADFSYPEIESIIISPQKWLSNCYKASRYLREVPTSDNLNDGILIDLFSEEKIIIKELPCILKDCVGESLSDFLMSLRKINILQRKSYKTGRVFDGCVYFRETKSWLVLSFSEETSWLKCSHDEMLRLYKPTEQFNHNDLMGIPQQTIIPHAFVVEKNHVTTLTVKESELFIKDLTRAQGKSQKTCYTLAGKERKIPQNSNIILIGENVYRAIVDLAGLTQGYSTNFKRGVRDVAINNPYLLCAWDIESYSGPENRQIPYVISLVIFTDAFFHMASNINPLYLTDFVEKSILLKKSFIGDDCVDQFVEFVTDFFFHNTCESILGYLREEIYLFTFNGTRYDHPLVIKKLLTFGCELIGEGINNPKSIVVRKTRDCFAEGPKSKTNKMAQRKLIFNDFYSLHPTGSLKSVCQSLFPENKDLHKSDFDIGGLDKENFLSKIRPITKYCEQDCVALTACILVNRVNTNKLIFQILNLKQCLSPIDKTGVLPVIPTYYWSKVIYPWDFDVYKLISASQWTFEIFKTYFLPFYCAADNTQIKIELEGEENETIHQIVRSTYRGGLTCVYTQEFVYENEDNNLQIYDINSSYPNSMVQEVPYSRFKPKTEKICIDNDSPLNSFNDMDLYYVEYMDMGKYSLYRYYDTPAEYESNVLRGVNIQDIYPFAQPSSHKKIKDLGLIYPRFITFQWIWGKELNMFISTYTDLLADECSKLGDVFRRIKIIEVLSQNNQINPDMMKKYNPNLLFKPFIEFFYTMKAKCKEDPSIKPLEPLYKLFLNGLYGKFGQTDYPEVSYAYGGLDLKFLARNPDSVNISQCGVSREQINPVYKIETAKGYRSSGACVRIASYISMHSRMNLWRTMVMITSNVKGLVPLNRPQIYYCDTDSIFMKGKFPDCYKDDKKLGAWKMEDPLDYVKKYCPGVSKEVLESFKPEHAFFMAPKCYGIFSRKMLTEFKDNIRTLISTDDLDESSKTLLGWVKTKGVSKGKLDLHGFLELVLNKSICVSQLQFSRKMGSVYVNEDFKKTIRLKYNKRIFTDPLLSSSAFETIIDFESYVFPLLKKK